MARLDTLPDGVLSKIITRLPDPGPLAAASHRLRAAAAGSAEAWFLRHAPCGRALVYSALTWRYLAGRSTADLAAIAAALGACAAAAAPPPRRPQRRRRGAPGTADAGGGGWGSSGSDGSDGGWGDDDDDDAGGGGAEACGPPLPRPPAGWLAAAGAAGEDEAAAAARLLRLCTRGQLLLLPYAAAAGREALVSALLALQPAATDCLGPGLSVQSCSVVAWAAKATLQRCAAAVGHDGSGGGGGGGRAAASAAEAQAERVLRRLSEAADGWRWQSALELAAALGAAPLRAALRASPDGNKHT
jgi:hypothetical protein